MAFALLAICKAEECEGFLGEICKSLLFGSVVFAEHLSSKSLVGH